MSRYNTPEEVLALGKIDPELDALLKANPPPPNDFSDITKFKAVSAERMAGLKAMLGSVPADTKKTELHYTTEDGTQLRACLYQPTTTPHDGSPLIVIFHGGGFCIGGPEGEEQTCISLVQAFGAVCISASYRLAPEFKFPFAVTDAWDALKWAAANAKSFGADPARGFIVGGTSAGANIAAVLTLMARDEEFKPTLTGQYLAIPPIVPNYQVPEKYKHLYLSMEQNKDTPVLPAVAIDMFMEAYDADENDPRFAPLTHPKGLARLPPTYFQINGMDPLRDDGLIYEKVLREDNGVKTRLDMYPGLPHGFWSFFPALKSAKRFREDLIEGFGWLLGRKPDMQQASTEAMPTVV